MRRRRTAPIPASLPRDLTLYLLRKHDPGLAASIVKSTAKYLPNKKVIRATIDYDPVRYVLEREKR